MKGIIIQFINEWKQFILSNTELKWITFTFFDFEIEKEDWLGQFIITIIVFGFGIYIGIIYKETDKLKEIMELATKEAEKINSHNK